MIKSAAIFADQQYMDNLKFMQLKSEEIANEMEMMEKENTQSQNRYNTTQLKPSAF